MFDHDIIEKLLKYGGVGLGILLAGGFVIGLIKLLQIIVPVVLALKPANGRNDAGGQLFVILSELSGLVGEVKLLTAELKGFTITMKDHVITKAELLTQFSQSRHDMRAIVGEGVVKINEVLIDQRKYRMDRRKVDRGTDRRR